MPAWLLTIIVNFALKFGIPFVVDWLKKKFGIAVDSQLAQVLSDYVEETKTNKKQAKHRAKTRLKECIGVACPSELKS